MAKCQKWQIKGLNALRKATYISLVVDNEGGGWMMKKLKTPLAVHDESLFINPDFFCS